MSIDNSTITNYVAYFPRKAAVAYVQYSWKEKYKCTTTTKFDGSMAERIFSSLLFVHKQKSQESSKFSCQNTHYAIPPLSLIWPSLPNIKFSKDNITVTIIDGPS